MSTVEFYHFMYIYSPTHQNVFNLIKVWGCRASDFFLCVSKKKSTDDKYVEFDIQIFWHAQKNLYLKCPMFIIL